MKTRIINIFLIIFSLLLASIDSAQDSCPAGMRKTYVDDTNMNQYGSARKWLAAISFYQFAGSLFFQRRVLIEPRFEVHLKVAMDAVTVIENPGEQKVYGFTIVISGNKNTISHSDSYNFYGQEKHSTRAYKDLGYNNYVNALIIEFDFVQDVHDPGPNSFSIRYCGTTCHSYDNTAFFRKALDRQKYIPGRRNEWDFRFVYQRKRIFIYSGSNSIIYQGNYDLERQLKTNIAYVGFTGFHESTSTELNIMGSFICEDNYVISRMKGNFLKNNRLYQTTDYQPGETINYAFQFINNQGAVVPHTYNNKIWDYSFFVNQDCNSKGSYKIYSRDSNTLVLSMAACTSAGQHSIRLNEEKKGAGPWSYYRILPGPMKKITLVGHDGRIARVPLKSETKTFYLNYGGSRSGDFIIRKNLKIILDFQITDIYGNKVNVGSPNSLFILKKVNPNQSTSNVNSRIISYTLASRGNYYQMTISVGDVGTYQIDKNIYMEKPIKFSIIPDDADASKSYCTLEKYSYVPTVNVGTTFYYRCYLRDRDGRSIDISTFRQNSQYDFICSAEKSWPSPRSYSTPVYDKSDSYQCSYKVTEIGDYAYNGYLIQKSNKKTTRITSKVNQFYVRGNPNDYIMKKIMDPSNKRWSDIESLAKTVITYVPDSKGFITAIDFAESIGNILISSYRNYPSGFNINNLKIKLYSTHDGSFVKDCEPRFITLSGSRYVGIYTKSGVNTNNIIKKSSFNYYLKFNYFRLEKTAAIRYNLNIGSYVTCFHDLNEKNTKVNINNNIQLITGEGEKKIGSIVLSTKDNNLYNYNIGTGKIQTILSPANRNIILRVVPLQIEGTYDVYVRPNQDYSGRLEIKINGVSIRVITLVSEPSKACYIEWVESKNFKYQRTSGRDYYYLYNGVYDNGNILVNFILKDKYKNKIEKGDYFTKFADISSEEYGTNKNYFSVSFNSKTKRYEFRDNLPYANKQRGWVFKARDSSCNHRYFVRYDGRNGGSPLTKENSYFTLLTNRININNIAFVDVIYKDKNNKHLGLQKEKLNDARLRTKVIAVNTKGRQEVLNYDSTTSNYALRYRAKYTVSGDYTIKVTLDNNYALKNQNSNQLKVIDNIFDLASSKLKMITNKIIDMNIKVRTNIDNVVSTPVFRLECYSKDNIRTNYNNKVNFKLVLISDKFDEESDKIYFDVNKRNADYIQFTFPSKDELYFHRLLRGDYKLLLQDDKTSLTYPIYLLGDGKTDYSNEKYYDISKTDVRPTAISCIAGRTYTINVEIRAKDRLRWNYDVDLSKFKFTYSQGGLQSKDIAVKVQRGAKRGQVTILVTQNKVGSNNFAFTYEGKKITTGVALTIKCAELNDLKLIQGPTNGDVISPPIIKFMPTDRYDNLYTDLFSKSTTKAQLNALTVGISTEKKSLASNNYVTEGKYLIVQYTSDSSTDVVVSSRYLKKSYSYRIRSGPINKGKSFAEIKSAPREAGGLFYLLISPKDEKSNDIDDLGNAQLKQFTSFYKTFNGKDDTQIKDCYLTKRTGSNKNTNIECKVTITKVGNLQFSAKYSNNEISCNNQCRFTVVPSSLLFTNSKTYYTNRRVYLTTNGQNEVQIGSYPIFELSFYDRFMNQLDQNTVNGMNVGATLENTDVKLCVNNGGKIKKLIVCPTSRGDDNENKYKYLINGVYNLLIKNNNRPSEFVKYPIKITGGSSGGSSEPVALDKTTIEPASLTLAAGDQGKVKIQINTAKSQRKNYWYPEPKEKIKITFDSNANTCSSSVGKGDLPGQYIIQVSCTKTIATNNFAITIENYKLPKKVKLTINSALAYYLEVINQNQFHVSSDRYTWKTNPTNDDVIKFSFRLKDRYHNYITNDISKTNQFSIISETYGSRGYYSLQFDSKNYLYTLTDKIPFVITKHTWNINVLNNNNRKYSFIYNKNPGVPDLSKSYWTIDKTSYIMMETSTISIYLLDKLGVNLGTLNEKLNVEKNSLSVIYNNGKNQYYSYKSTSSSNVMYTHVYNQKGNYKVSVSYKGKEIGQKKNINVAYKKVEMKNSKLYYNINNKNDILMLTNRQTNINSLQFYPFYKFYFYDTKGGRITLYDKSLQASCFMTYNKEKWDMVVTKKDDYLEIRYKQGFEQKFKKLPLGMYYLQVTFNNEYVKYPLYLLGEKDVSVSSDYNLAKTFIEPRQIHAIAGEEKEVEIEFRASDGLRWNYEVTLLSFGVSNSLRLNSKQLQIQKLRGSKNGKMKLKIKQLVSTADNKPNVFTLTYASKTIPHTISLYIKSSKVKTLVYKTGAVDGTVLSPPTLQFVPLDEYGNICTQIFDPKEYPKNKLEALTNGKSTNNYPITSNIKAENGILYVQYSCNKVTTIQVKSGYFGKTYSYKLNSGPIHPSTSYAQVVAKKTVIAGEVHTINIYPKDVNGNDVTSFGNSEISNFELQYSFDKEFYKSISKDCKKKVQGTTSFITCQTTITKSGDIKFIASYSEKSIECKNCEYKILPHSLDFSKTKVVNQNNNEEMSRTKTNVIPIINTPRFALSFYDKYMNAIINKDEVQKLNVQTRIDVSDIKLCMENGNLNKISFLCKSTSNDENEERWKYIPSKKTYKYIVYTQKASLVYPLEIKGGYKSGEPGPVDFSKTYVHPTSLKLVAGEEEKITLELRTKDRLRKNYWYQNVETHLGVKFTNNVKDCKYTIEKGNNPGQYTIKLTCTKKRDAFTTIVVVENKEVPQKVSMKVIPNDPARSELLAMNRKAITNKNLGSVSVESKFQMINKLYDKHDNLITDLSFDLSKLKIKIEPTVSVENYNYKVETVAQKNGEILVTLKSTYAGDHVVSGLLLPLPQYSIKFTHGRPNPENSILEVGQKEAWVAEKINIYITPYDKYFNLIDANEYAKTSPYQVKYTNGGNTIKVITEKPSIKKVNNVKVLSYSGAFYVRGNANFYGYVDNKKIKCVSCLVDIKSKDIDFESSLVKRYENSKRDFELLKAGITEKNVQEEPVYRLYPRDKYLNTIDFITEEKIKTYTARLESQSEKVKYNLRLNNREFKDQAYAEFVIDDASSPNKYSNLIGGYYNLIFTDGIKSLKYNISLMGDGKGGSNEPPDYQKTHIDEQDLKFIAGETGYLILEIRTAKNIRRNSDNFEIKVKSCDANDMTFQANTTKAGLLGVFHVTITSKKANTYPKLNTCPLNIYVNNTLVKALHPQMEVSPNDIVETTVLGKYFKANSKTELLEGDADTNYIFEVLSVDQFNNLAETKQDTIELKVEYQGEDEIESTSENDINTGYRKYTVVAKKAGIYVISTSKSGSQGVYLRNENNFKINPGVIDLTKTIIKEKASPIEAGNTPEISLVAYDKYDNVLYYTDYINKFKVIFIDSNNTEFVSSSKYDNETNKVYYTSNDKVTIVGDTHVDVTYDAKDKIDTSKVIIKIEPDDPYPEHTILSREISPEEFVEYLDGDNFVIDPTETLKLNVTLYDRYKNFIYNLPENAEVQNPLMSGKKMKKITFTVTKNTSYFDLDFSENAKYVHIYEHLVKGTYDLTFTVSSSIGKKDFHYYMTINVGDDLHGNGDYLISKSIIKPDIASFVAGTYQKFSLELRDEDGLLYNDDIDINNDLIIGKVNDATFESSIIKAGSDYGIYTITIYSEKKGEYDLNIAMTDLLSSSGEKKNMKPAKYSVTPDPLPDQNKTEIVNKPEPVIGVDSSIRLTLNLYDKFNNKIVSTDNIVNTDYFTLLNNGEPYSYNSLNFDNRVDTYLVPKYPPKKMSLNLLYNNNETTVFILENNIEVTIQSYIDYKKTQIVSSNKEKIYAGQQLDMWLYTLDRNNLCLDNGDDLSSTFEIEVNGPLDSPKQYKRIFKVKKTKKDDENNTECNNEYQIDNSSVKDPIYKYAGNYMIKVRYLRKNLLAQFSQVCYPLDYSIAGFNLKYNFNPASISILDSPSFTLTGTDIYGNKVSDPLLDDINITFTYNNKEIDFDTIKGIEIQEGTVYYEVAIHLVGSYQLHIFYKGQEIEKVNNFKENLPKFTILTGPCFAENNNNFILPQANETEVKEQIIFSFQCYDMFKNKITKGGEKFTVKGEYLTNTNDGDVIPYDGAKILDNGDGSYKVEFIPDMKGIYFFNLLIGKEKYGEEITIKVTDLECNHSQIVCPNKRKCVDDILECIDPPSNCPISKPFNCTVNDKYTCVKSRTECDCPENYIKCNLTNYCVPKKRRDMCPIFKYKQASCQVDNLKMNKDGICRKEQSGPNQRVCPIGKVLCADFSCRDNYDQCIVTQRRPKKMQRCLGQDIVRNADDCPSSITCSSKDEFVCPTGECVTNEIYCPKLTKCNKNYPYLCQNNICAKDAKSCPHSVSCGRNKLLCKDNICRESC